MQSHALQSDHSLGPDIFTGWQSHTALPKVKQIALVFANPTLDLISKTLTAFGSNLPYKMVYLGPRFTSNVRAFRQYSANSKTEQVEEHNVYDSKKLLRFSFRSLTERQKYFPIRASEYRVFVGQNPTNRKEELIFDSDFQCGNLDAAVAVAPDEYDLTMRVDSNTKGHTNWFYFRVRCFSPNQKVRFNIINFKKGSLPYSEGMKPYIWRSSSKRWTQQDIPVQFKQRKLRFSEAIHDFCGSSEELAQATCLSFTFEFAQQDKEVYFAYCVPYSYSLLLSHVEDLQTRYKQFIKVDNSHESSGGLTIPVLCITNHTSERAKISCLCIARLHPGQTQGSWIMNGFLQYICSPAGNEIRERVIFWIVPMVNVDGVVLGNFRTGIGGRDLNRVFHQPQAYPQVALIRSLAQKHKPEIFLDFHGHSTKKNVFVYGPEYRLEDKYYILSRTFPKFASKTTKAFRYHACSFKISQSKRKTARALLLRQDLVPYTYTVEASCYSYGHKTSQVKFTSQEYISVGGSLAESLLSFVRLLSIIPKRMEDKKTSSNDSATGRLSRSPQKVIKDSRPLSSLNPHWLDNLVEGSLLTEIMDQEATLEANASQSAVQDSDCESQTDDYNDDEIAAIVVGNKPQLFSYQGLNGRKKKNRKNKHSRSMNVKSPSSSLVYQSASVIVADTKTQVSPPKAFCNTSLKKSVALGCMKRPQVNRVGIIPRIKSQSLNIIEVEQPYEDKPSKISFQSRHRQPSRVSFQFQNSQILPSEQGQIKIAPIFSVKRSLLPALFKVEGSESQSMMTEIIEQHQRKLKMNIKTRNIKILYI